MDIEVSSNPTYLFGDYRLIVASMRLEKGTATVALTPRVFSTLQYLVENAGRTVSKDELLQALWPNRIADESNLSQAISTARRALGPDGSSFIMTIPGRGYKFTATVTQLSHHTPLETPPIFSTKLVSEAQARTGLSWLWILAAAVIGAVGLGLFWLVVRHHQTPSSNSDIVLADLQNFTGDRAFDHVIPRILQIDLAQSPQLQIPADGKIAETLELMERARTQALTPAVALSVCARINGIAVIVPSIAALGQRYLLTLSAFDCTKGKLLYDEKQTAEDKDDVSHAVDALSARMRQRFGEVVASVARYDVPIAPERTSSFEALHAYSEGEWTIRQGKTLDAIAFFRHAVELDPDFAMAWLALSEAYYGIRQPVEEAAAISEAYQRRASVSERDALMIDVRYNMAVTQNLDAALQSATLLVRLYPSDAVAWGILANLQTRLADPLSAIASASRALQLEPQRSYSYTMLARALIHNGDLARAERIDEEVLRVAPETGQVRQQRLALRFLQGDQLGGQRLLSSAVGTPLEREALLEGYNFAVAHGRLREADAMFNRANVLGRPDGFEPNYGEAAFNYAALGLLNKGREALALVPKNEWTGEDDYYAAILDAPDVAAADLKRDLARWPKSTLLNGKYAPEARAALLLRAEKPREAVRELDASDRFMFLDLDGPYLRAAALLSAKDGAGAAVGFRAVLARKGYAWDEQFWLAQLGLARALRLTGDANGSRREYESFLAAWRNADPDLPAVQQAKREYAEIAPRPLFQH
jgi:DNA-binding winged helix-turn-helix (wHTH) protein/Flp pilus assembly protein TadD